MKLRTAKKIYNAIGTGCENRYTPVQRERALGRVEATKSSKAAHRHWNALMQRIGVDGRAWLLNKHGRSGDAFDLLMRQGK